MHALVYVSRRRNHSAELALEVEDILRVSLPRNASLSVTGAPIATPRYFAQYLEGPQRALADLIASINSDLSQPISAAGDRRVRSEPFIGGIKRGEDVMGLWIEATAHLQRRWI